MPRELSASEAQAFLARAPKAASDVATHAQLTPDGQVSKVGNIPEYGRAYLDPATNYYVLISIDARYHFRFIELSDFVVGPPDNRRDVSGSVVDATNKPPFVSPSQSVFDDIMAQTASVTGGVLKPVNDLFSGIRDDFNRLEGNVRNLLIIAIIGIVVIAVAVAFKGIEAPGLRIG